MHTARVGCISSQYRSCSWSYKIPEKVRQLYNLDQINNFEFNLKHLKIIRVRKKSKSHPKKRIKKF